MFRIRVMPKGDLRSAVLCFFLETVIEVAAEDNHDGISTPVLGCIGLSVTLFLLLALNAAQCAHRKRRNGKYTQSPLIFSVSWFVLAAFHD